MIATLEKANDLIDQKQLQIEELTKKLQSTEHKMNMLQHQVEHFAKSIGTTRGLVSTENSLSNIKIETAGVGSLLCEKGMNIL